ncbi:head GIN domain-containing protein [Dokdonia sp. Hel_I_53]|uniref:head GIN domain-containing protein n=1 Tax=Dokdonia sp. Hel_I_53 TaxID=1566287 RepID=UPI001645A5AC|nr:head GIN domain-containing protein [Dokdonia sp. Hel_I_53]
MEYYILSRKRTSAFIILINILMIGCNSENSTDCLQTDGKDIGYEVVVSFFDKLQLEDDIRVILKQGDEQSVFVQTGENIAPEIYVDVIEETLIMRNDNSCNIFRDYGKTVVTVTSPNISFIRQASSYPIMSDGTLSYPSLLIWSNTEPTRLLTDANKSGDVFLDLDVEILTISINGSSNFVLSGHADKALFVLSDEYPQLDAGDLIVNEISVKHVSAAKMIVHPIESLRGQVRATGDLISVNRPPVVEVEEFFTGQLIFEN